MKEKKKCYWNNQDVKGSILFFCIGLFILAYSLINHYEVNGPWKMSPYLFPTLISIILITLSFTLLFEGVKAVDRGEVKEKPKTHWKRVFMYIGITLLYYFIMPHLGFIITNIVMLIALFLLLGLRVWWKIAILSVSTTIIIYYLFHVLLYVMLP